MPPSKPLGAPLSESSRLARERRLKALEEAKALKAAAGGLFGDISVICLPPDPAIEEPPPDEPLSEEDKEIERAYQESASAATAADVEALAAYAGAQEGPSAAEAQQAADAAAEAAREEAYGVLRCASCGEVRDPLMGCPNGHDSEPEELAASELPAEGEEALGRSEAPEANQTSASGADTVPGASSAPAGFALFGHNLFGDQVKAKASGPLAERFKVPPFTVLDARNGIWQDRKRAWLALGIQSEVGRGENLLNMSDTVLEPDPVKRAEMVKQREAKRKHAFGQEFVLGAQPGIDGAPGGQGKAWATSATGISRKLAPGGGGGGAWIGGPKTSSSGKYGREGEDDVVLDENGQPLASKTGTSIFDPVLTELLYSWFVPPAGLILDPFAGGSVRGIVAAKLRRIYVGIELRAEQIAANEKQAEKICSGEDAPPVWIEGDSANAKELTDGGAFDFVMACPPYADLEQYSEDPRDLSNMTYPEFAAAYERIIAAALGLLKPDRFACFVVGDIRDEKGFYRGLPELTVRCFEEHGARKYNEAVLVTSVGSLPIRINKQFGKGRKLGKTHQNVLIFVKGDPFRAAEACGGQQELSL